MRQYSTRRDERDHRLIYIYRTPGHVNSVLYIINVPHHHGVDIFIVGNTKRCSTDSSNVWQVTQKLSNGVKQSSNIFLAPSKKYGAIVHCCLRRLTNIASEVALMNLTYNIRRVLNIVGTKNLMLLMQSG